MSSPLTALFGDTAAKVLLYLFHHRDGYPTGISKDLGVRLSAVQRQLEKLEAAGVLVSRLVGRTRLYAFDPRNPATDKLKEFLGVFYEGMPLRERERMFRARRRPRRRGKPVKRTGAR